MPAGVLCDPLLGVIGVVIDDGVHVGSEHHDGALSAAVNESDDAVTGDAVFDGNAVAAQKIDNVGLGQNFLARGLGDVVQFPTKGDGAIEMIHVTGPSWRRPKRLKN